DDLPRMMDAYRRSIETGQPLDVENRSRRADGVYRWFHVRGRPQRDAQGRIVRWYNLVTDIDERKRAEEELRRSEAYLTEAQHLSRTGSFGCKVSSGEMFWSEETFSNLWIRSSHQTCTGSDPSTCSSGRQSYGSGA